MKNYRRESGNTKTEDSKKHVSHKRDYEGRC